MDLLASCSTLEEWCKELAGNHREFESFAWDGEPEDSDLWAIINVSHRDADCLTESNANAMRELLAPYMAESSCAREDEAIRYWHGGERDPEALPDVSEETHGHWACGYVEALVVRIYHPDGRTITEAARELHRIAEALEDYPVLDDEDLSQRECDEAEEYITDSASWVLDRDKGEALVDDLPDDWAGEVYSWLFDEKSCCRAEEYSHEDIAEALRALGFVTCDDDEEE